MNFQDFKNLNKVPTYNVFFFYHFSENSHFLVHNLVLKLKRQVIRKHSERKLLTILLFRYVCISRKKNSLGKKIFRECESIFVSHGRFDVDQIFTQTKFPPCKYHLKT